MTAQVRSRDPLDCSVSMLTANLLVLVSAGPIVAALGWAYSLRWGAPSLAQGVWRLLDPRIFLATVIPGILAHELIHAVAWSIAARRPLSAIRIGIQWRAVSPYAHPKEPMPVGPYRVGALMPAVVLGFLPAGLAILLGWPLLMAWSLVFLLAAGGDFVVLWLIRHVPAGRLVQDHPTRAGCHVLEDGPPLTSPAASR
jgi:Putative zincin peptidase